MNDVLQFLRFQKLMTLACHSATDLWIANVYVGIDENGTIYFISPKDNKHSKLILQNPSVAFSFAWFDQTNHKNRKAIQGLGVCQIAKDETEIAKGVGLHNANFPEFKERITVEWIKTNEWGSCVWILKPTMMKYWDDELYKDQESKEFTFTD